jgi:hypothetical protein
MVKMVEIQEPKETVMRVYPAVIERCPETGVYVGFVPGFPGAHSQGETLDELTENLREVISMSSLIRLNKGAGSLEANRGVTSPPRTTHRCIAKRKNTAKEPGHEISRISLPRIGATATKGFGVSSVSGS